MARKRPAANDPLTASSQLLTGDRFQQYAITYKNWEEELWAYRKSVGEFASVMNWFAAGFGRIHLRAGVWKPDQKEPEFLDTGRPAELVHELVNKARGGETQFMRSWALHIAIPGVGFFVGEDNTPIGRQYDVKSANVIKTSARTFADSKNPAGPPLSTYDIQIAPDRWRTLDPNESFVARIYDPDPQLDYLPTSMTQAALTTLREIDLYNRAITATLLSRIAFNGILFIPEEATFPVNPQFQEAPDPFVAELLHYAQRGIKDPGSPGAALPFPLRINSAFIEKFKHLVLSSGLDPKIIEARESAVRRLAEQLPAPPEAMTGVGDMNHWSAWQASEDNVKMYFGPPAEILVGGLTEQWLRYMLIAEKSPLVDKDGNPYVVWYDASDLTTKPDNSSNAIDARQRGVINDESYLEILGITPDAMADPKERREIILLNLAMNGTALPDSYFLLYPEDRDKVTPKAATPEGGNQNSVVVGPSPEQGPPSAVAPKAQG